MCYVDNEGDDDDDDTGISHISDFSPQCFI